MKTNAARILETLGVRYATRAYEVDPDDLVAESVARKIGMPPEQVFKTLVVKGDRTGPIFAVVPGNAELDFKAIARVSKNKACEMLPLKEVEPLTGYIRGGVTALAAKKALPVFVDETVHLFDEIALSAGVRGLQLVLAPDDYVRATSATVGAISREKTKPTP